MSEEIMESCEKYGCRETKNLESVLDKGFDEYFLLCEKHRGVKN